jgi:hypothetical protein
MPVTSTRRNREIVMATAAPNWASS